LPIVSAERYSAWGLARPPRTLLNRLVRIGYWKLRLGHDLNLDSVIDIQAVRIVRVDLHALHVDREPENLAVAQFYGGRAVRDLDDLKL
jgi:hypothetical protein